MAEAPGEYTKRILGYVGNSDPLSVQRATAERLAQLIAGRKAEELFRAPAPGKWSVAEILAHLADAEIAIAWRLRQILSSSGVTLQAYDQEKWASAMEYRKRDPTESLANFRAFRSADLALLQTIPAALWDNYGRHEERGQESVRHVVSMVAGHDLNHLAQIEQILMKA